LLLSSKTKGSSVMKKHYQLYSMVNGKRKHLLATFYNLEIAKEIINTSMTSYDLALFYKQEKIYSIAFE